MDEQDLSVDFPTSCPSEQEKNSEKSVQTLSTRTILSNDEPVLRHPCEDNYDGLERQDTYMPTANKRKISQCSCLCCLLLCLIFFLIMLGGAAAGLYFKRCQLGILNTYFPILCPKPLYSIAPFLNASFVPLSQSLMVQHNDSLTNTFAYVLQPIEVILYEIEISSLDVSNITLAVLQSNVTSYNISLTPFSATSFIFTVPWIAAGSYQFKLNLSGAGVPEAQYCLVYHTIDVIELPLTHYNVFNSLNLHNVTTILDAIDAVLSPLHVSTSNTPLPKSLTNALVEVASLSDRSEVLFLLETLATESTLLANTLEQYSTSPGGRRLSAVSAIRSNAASATAAITLAVAKLSELSSLYASVKSTISQASSGLLSYLQGRKLALFENGLPALALLIVVFYAAKVMIGIIFDEIVKHVAATSTDVTPGTSGRRRLSSAIVHCKALETVVIGISATASVQSVSLSASVQAEYPDLYNAVKSLSNLFVDPTTAVALSFFGLDGLVASIQSELLNPDSGVVPLAVPDVTADFQPPYCSTSDLISIDCDCSKIPSGASSVRVIFDVVLNGFLQPASAPYTTTSMMITLTLGRDSDNDSDGDGDDF